jgi:anti-sigma B factor antagonist
MTKGRVGERVWEPADRRFAVSGERVNGTARVRLEGEMDLAVIGEVDREMQRAEATDAERIVLDLDGLEFMDASGIRLLLELNERSQSNGGRLRITGIGAPQVRRVLELTGVDELLPLEA